MSNRSPHSTHWSPPPSSPFPPPYNNNNNSTLTVPFFLEPSNSHANANHNHNHNHQHAHHNEERAQPQFETIPLQPLPPIARAGRVRSLGIQTPSHQLEQQNPYDYHPRTHHRSQTIQNGQVQRQTVGESIRWFWQKHSWKIKGFVTGAVVGLLAVGVWEFVRLWRGERDEREGCARE